MTDDTRPPHRTEATAGSPNEPADAGRAEDEPGEAPADESAVPDAAPPSPGWESGDPGGDRAHARSSDRPADPSLGYAPGSEYGDSGDFAILGGEAAVPPRDYGPPIASVLDDPARRRREMRELERRMRARMTPAFPIEHRRRLPFELLWKRYRNVAMRGRSERVDELGRDPAVVTRFQPALDFLYRTYFRVEAHGVERVPAMGQAIIVANHAGTLPYDGLMVMQAMHNEHPARRDARPLIEDFVFHFPYLGTLINRLGGVRACPENAERLLANKRVIIAFPEGHKGMGKLYRDRYKLQRFGRGGFVKLALRTRSPIIPVAIVGAEESMPMLRKVTWLTKSLGVPYIPITPTFPLLGPLGLLPAPSKWTLRFCEPIDVAADYGPERADDRVLVNKLAERIRSTIQDAVAETLAQRQSVFFG